MKLIIVEGCDRVGKNLLCDELYKMATLKNSNVTYRHWRFPLGETNADKIMYQKMSFQKEFTLFREMNFDSYYTGRGNDLMIWNRAHIGEYVYGTIYRNYEPNWIYNLEILHNFDENPEIYLILLDADAEFVCANDDGHSFSNDIETKNKELELFRQAFKKSHIQNKLNIKVNDGNQFRNSRNILNEVQEFIKY